MKSILKLVILSASLVNVPAFAENLYSGLTFSQVTIDGAGGEVKPFTGTVKVGYQFARSFALEAQYGSGISDDDIDGTTVDVDKQMALFLRIGGSSSYNGVRLYLLAGHSRTELATEPAGGDDNEFAGTAWGIGAEEFSKSIKNMAYVFEYIRYYDDSDAEITGISLGVRYNF